MREVDQNVKIRVWTMLLLKYVISEKCYYQFDVDGRPRNFVRRGKQKPEQVFIYLF
jgi:hypothetical protein